MARKPRKDPIKARKRRKRSIKPTPSNLLRIPGTSRRYRIKGTKQTLSRRQAEKILGRKPRVNRQRATSRFRSYLAIRDSYIEAQRAKGRSLSKRAAMQSDALKKVIRDLHSKDPEVKAKALARTGRITRDQVEQYVEKFTQQD